MLGLSTLSRTWATASMSSVIGSLVNAFIFLPKMGLAWFMAIFGVGLLISFPILLCAGFPAVLLERLISHRIHHRKTFIYMCLGGVAGSVAAIVITALAFAFNYLPKRMDIGTLTIAGKLILCGFSYGSLHGLFNALNPPKS